MDIVEIKDVNKTYPAFSLKNVSFSLEEGMIEVFSAYFSKQLSEKVSRGMYLNAEKCKYNGGQKTWGYTINEEKHYVIDETVAPIIKEIFERVADGEPQSAIIENLNARAIKTSRGKEFTKNSIQNILKNEKYKGTYSFGDVTIEHGIPAIVDSDLFERVQNELAKNRMSRGNRKSKGENYLLTGKLFCGYCKKSMVGTSGKSGHSDAIYRYYICAGKKDGCKKSNVKKEWIEDLILDQCRNQFTTELVDEIVELIIEENERIQQSTELERLQQLLKSAEKEIENLILAIEKGVAAERLSERINYKDQEIESIKHQIEQEKANMRTIDPTVARSYLSQLCQGEMQHPKYDKVLIDTLVEKVYLYDDHFHLFFNVSGSSDIPNERIIELNSEMEKCSSNESGSDLAPDGVPTKECSFNRNSHSFFMP